MNKPVRILIADDHSLVREGLKIALAELDCPVQVLEAGTAQEVQDALEGTESVQLIVLDLHMPGTRDLELLKTLCNTHPEIPLVVVSADEHPRTMQRAIEHGAAGFIPKSAAHNVLASALRLVLSGGVYIPHQLLGQPATSVHSTGTEHAAGKRELITGRQKDVLELVAAGHSNKAIARQLRLSEHTIKIHLSAAFKTLGVSNRTEAAMACREIGLFDPE